MITQLDVLARQSMVKGSTNIQGLRGISTIPTAPASLAVLNHVGSGATQGPVYSVQTLSLGVTPETSKHDFLPQFAQGSVAWRAQKAPTSLLHLSAGAVATAGSALGGALGSGRSAIPSVPPLGGLKELGDPSVRDARSGPPLRRPNSAFPSRSLTRFPRPRTALFGPTLGVDVGGPVAHGTYGNAAFGHGAYGHVAPSSPPRSPASPVRRTTSQDAAAAAAAAAIPADVLASAEASAAEGDELFLAFLRERKSKAEAALPERGTAKLEPDYPERQQQQQLQQR